MGYDIFHDGEKDDFSDTHMQPMVLVYLPTKLGDLWGKCW